MPPATALVVAGDEGERAARVGRPAAGNDSVGPIYHKSAVYLVTRGFEDALGRDTSEVPLVGLAKSWDAPLDGTPGRTLPPAAPKRRKRSS